MTNGQLITGIRETLGWSRRKLASKFGTSTRKVVAMETDTDPQPRKENRVFRMLFIPFLGYSVRSYTDLPVRDVNFDLNQQQARMLQFLSSDKSGV